MSIKFNKPYLVNNQPRVMRRQTRVPTALAAATMSTWVLGRSAGSLTGSASGSTSWSTTGSAVPITSSATSYFLGYLPEHQDLYSTLQTYGYTFVFKPVMYRGGKPKGNVDAELVLQAMIDYRDYERAVIVTSDGDFACLVRYLYEQPGRGLTSSKMRGGNWNIKVKGHPLRTEPESVPRLFVTSSLAGGFARLPPLL